MESTKGPTGFVRAGLDVLLVAFVTAYEASEILKSSMHSSASPSMVIGPGIARALMCITWVFFWVMCRPVYFA